MILTIHFLININDSPNEVQEFWWWKTSLNKIKCSLKLNLFLLCIFCMAYGCMTVVFCQTCIRSLLNQQLQLLSSVLCFAYLPGNCLATIGCCCRTYLIYPLRGLFGGPLDWEVRYFTGLMNVAGTTLVDLQTMWKAYYTDSIISQHHNTNLAI